MKEESDQRNHLVFENETKNPTALTTLSRFISIDGFLSSGLEPLSWNYRFSLSGDERKVQMRPNSSTVSHGLKRVDKFGSLSVGFVVLLTSWQGLSELKSGQR